MNFNKCLYFFSKNYFINHDSTKYFILTVLLPEYSRKHTFNAKRARRSLKMSIWIGLFIFYILKISKNKQTLFKNRMMAVCLPKILNILFFFKITFIPSTNLLLMIFWNRNLCKKWKGEYPNMSKSKLISVVWFIFSKWSLPSVDLGLWIIKNDLIWFTQFHKISKKWLDKI